MILKKFLSLLESLIRIVELTESNTFQVIYVSTRDLM